MRGDRRVLVMADATDPAATGNAVSSLRPDQHGAEARSDGPVRSSANAAVRDPAPGRYNPEGITEYNIVPGLIGMILTMTMVMMTALAMTRESERGTMENLLATPVAVEVMLGKIVPFVLVGFIQVTIILGAALCCSTCR